MSSPKGLFSRMHSGEGAVGPDPLIKHKAIGFLSNTGPDPQKNHNAIKPAFNVWPIMARP